MMKRVLPCVLILSCCVCTNFAGLADDPKTADGYLTAGEYVSSIWAENNDKLIIAGGNATTLDAWNSSRIEIYSTSLPLSYTDKRGVYDIHLHDRSTLLFSGGATESLVVKANAVALLTGGSINVITIYRRPQDSCLVTINCRPGWEWNASPTGPIIKGLWKNGDPFEIELYNLGSPWPPTANFVNIIPEPATLLLLSIGGLLIRPLQNPNHQ